MPRRGSVPKREILPDPVYRSKVLTKLINQVMLDGKKSLAETLVYRAMDIIKEKSGKNPLEVFEAAMKNIMPIRSQGLPGRRRQLPGAYRGADDRRQTLAIRWLTKYSRNVPGGQWKKGWPVKLWTRRGAALPQRREDT